jgi:SAM-dependent methyltransferase
MSTTTTPASKTTARRTDIYNDPSFNYAQFWSGRDYEHHAEVIALEYLLRGRKFGHAIDIGGGFGRLSVILAGYADRVTLVDPSSQQLALSEQIFPGHPKLERQLMDAANLGFDDETADLVTLIRVLHHLPDPAPELAELARILRPGGLAVIEVANSAHVANRLRYLLRGERVPRTPVAPRRTSIIIRTRYSRISPRSGSRLAPCFRCRICVIPRSRPWSRSARCSQSSEPRSSRSGNSISGRAHSSCCKSGTGSGGARSRMCSRRLFRR